MNFPFHYLIYGLRVRAEMALPELVALEVDEVNNDWDGSSFEVSICYGRVEIPACFQNPAGGCVLDDQVGTLFWRDTGAFQLYQGREITVDAAPGVSEALLRPFLLGPVLSSLLHQRGALVLHASAVALSGLSRDSVEGEGNRSAGAVAFLGQSQSGKSTMASVLHRRGHRALCDDVIAVPVAVPVAVVEDRAVPVAPSPPLFLNTTAQPLIFPGLPHLKLRPPTISALGHEAASLQHWHPSHDGFLMRLPAAGNAAASQPAPLRCFYVLEEAAAGQNEVQIEPMPSAAALMALVNNSFCVRALKAQGRAHNFLQCAALLQQVPVFRLTRPRDLARLDEVAREVEAHQATFSDEIGASI